MKKILIKDKQTYKNLKKHHLIIVMMISIGIDEYIIKRTYYIINWNILYY